MIVLRKKQNYTKNITQTINKKVMSNTSNSSSGLGLGTVLFLIFMVLKLTNYIDWSWWWVTSPLWIPIAIIGIVGIIALIIAVLLK